IQNSRLPVQRPGDDEAGDQEVAEGGVELGGFKVDHGDGALLAAGSKLRGSDGPHEERQREEGEERPGGHGTEEHRDSERKVGPNYEGEVAVMGRAAAIADGEGGDTGSGVVADVAPLIAVEDGRYEETDRDAEGQGLQAPLPGDGVVAADDHEGAHEEEDQG